MRVLKKIIPIIVIVIIIYASFLLLSDINKYFTCLNSNGLLFLSGFYKKDIELIEGKCSDLGLQLTENIFESEWVALKFTKIDGN